MDDRKEGGTFPQVYVFGSFGDDHIVKYLGINFRKWKISTVKITILRKVNGMSQWKELMFLDREFCLKVLSDYYFSYLAGSILFLLFLYSDYVYYIFLICSQFLDALLLGYIG